MGRPAKQVVQISYYNNRVIKVWDSVTLASKGVGVDASTISKACKGKQISAGGYQWRFKDPSPKLV